MCIVLHGALVKGDPEHRRKGGCPRISGQLASARRRGGDWRHPRWALGSREGSLLHLNEQQGDDDQDLRDECYRTACQTSARAKPRCSKKRCRCPRKLGSWLQRDSGFDCESARHHSACRYAQASRASQEGREEGRAWQDSEERQEEERKEGGGGGGARSGVR